MKKLSPKKKKIISQNQFGVILEDINGKFDLMIEGQKASDKKNESNFKVVFSIFPDLKMN
ncbi:hypothetical protein HY839_02670 [Candidatus Azambacteria bacterium]|nr:hypothetical protein [Candidatus Azambacteria bacterium]